MAEISPELRAALDVAKERIKVDSYFTVAMNKGLKGHAQGFWSGTAMGIATGALAGGLLSLAMLPMLPALVAYPVVAGLVGWPLILGFSGIGAATGGAVIGGSLGRAAGTAAGVMGEKERRERGEKLEQEVLASPERQREIVEAYRRDPVVEKDDTPGEAFATMRDRRKAWHSLFDIKTMGVTVLLCAAVGALIFGGWFMLAGGAGMVGLGLGALGATSAGMAAAIGGVIGGVTGVTFGITYPMIFAGLTKGVADLLSQKMVRGQTQFAPIKTAAQMQEEAQAVRGTFRPYIPEPANDRPTTRVQQAAEVSTLQEAPSQQITLH